MDLEVAFHSAELAADIRGLTPPLHPPTVPLMLDRFFLGQNTLLAV